MKFEIVVSANSRVLQITPETAGDKPEVTTGGERHDEFKGGAKSAAEEAHYLEHQWRKP